LSLPVCRDAVLSEEVQALANEIAGADTTIEIRELARRVAEAQIDLRRVRSARHQLLSRNLNNPQYDSLQNARSKIALIRSVLRRKNFELNFEDITEFLRDVPKGPLKFAVVISHEARQLSTFDRYERRALSRRKFAVRAFDEARRKNLSSQHTKLR
jgi:hypothetical protein